MAIAKLHISLFIVVASSLSKCLSIHHPSPIPVSPQIWASSLYKVDSFKEISTEREFRTKTIFQNEFISKNGSDYVILDITETIVFTCQSRVPVRWSFPHMAEVETQTFFAFDSTAKRLSKFNSNKPANQYFETFLRIRLPYISFLSVNVTCIAGEEESPHLESSSIHVFYAGRNRIEKKSEETIEIYVPPTKVSDTSGEDTIILPCRPATPNVTILLEKQIENKNNPNKDNSAKKWMKFKVPTKYVTFDPKRGFILLKDTIGKRDYIFGLYRCFPADDPEQNYSSLETGVQYVFINVTSTKPQQVPKEINFEAMLYLKDNASVSYGHQAFGNLPIKANSAAGFESPLICCSGVANSPPHLCSDRCDSPLQCNLLKTKMMRKIEDIDRYLVENQVLQNRSDCSIAFLPYEGIVFCKGETIKFVDSYFQIFAKDVANLSSRSKQSEVPQLTVYEVGSQMKSVSVSQKIFLTIGYPITLRELSKSEHHLPTNNLMFTLIEHPKLDSLEEDKQQNDNLDPPHIRLSRQDIQLRHADKIAEYPREYLYEGEPLILMCLGWRHLYEEGAHVSISWRNGTTSSVEPREVDKMHFRTIHFSDEIYVGGVSEYSLIHMFSKEVVVSMEMSSVECWMPLWNNSGWDKITRNLTIFESRLPQFTEGEGEETIHFYLGDRTFGKLEFEVVGGIPEPKLNVTKDGNDILYGTIYSRNHNLSSIFNVTVIQGGNEKNSSHVKFHRVQITFGQITHEIQGIYECTVENVKGKVSRRLRLVVLEKRNVAMTILYLIMAISGLLLLGLGLRHWWQPKCVRIVKRITTS